MSDNKNITSKLERLGRWVERMDRVLSRSLKSAEREYLTQLRDWEEEKSSKETTLIGEEEGLKASLEQAGAEFAKKRYLIERDQANNKQDISQIEADFESVKTQHEIELKRLSESKIKTMATYERQNSALADLYEEKRKHLALTKGKLEKELFLAKDNLNRSNSKKQKELEAFQEKSSDKVSTLKKQLESKREGWTLALDKMNKELEVMGREKDEVQKRLSSIRVETEGELSSIRSSISLIKEQLEVDKATLVEKAEEDQRRTENEVSEMKVDIEKNERELQTLVLSNEKSLKDQEEAFDKEEEAIKEALKSESEKRDYEQKVFEQEQKGKSKELISLKEEYEKKKWYWDNQIRNLMMKKSVQEAEFEAEKLRVDREARSSLRSLEATRDEMKRRLSELKSRHDTLKTHHVKEKQLLEQRWKWRKDRLWSMWQTRLETLKSERSVIQEQLDALLTSHNQTHSQVIERENHDQKRADDLDQSIIHLVDVGFGAKKQKEIQNELEKTRILAQIKECDILIGDWKDRLKISQEEIEKYRSNFGDQLNFIEKFYQQEEKETDLFLHHLKKVMDQLGLSLGNMVPKEDAA